MKTRLNLQSKLEDTLEKLSLLKVINGKSNVYYQPPPNVEMVYPAIVYRCDKDDIDYANNKPYTYIRRYSITIIDKNPDSLIPEKIAMYSMCIHDRNYTVDNLNHFVYNLYY